MFGVRDPDFVPKEPGMPPAPKPADSDGPEAPRETTIKAPPLKGSDKAGRALDGPMAKTELRHLLTGIYNIPNNAGMLEIQWEEKDFDADAAELVDIIDRVRYLRITLRVFAPLVAIVDMVRKARVMIAAYQAKQILNKANKQVIDHQPTGENGSAKPQESGFGSIFGKR